jgi:hypothetical protein
MTTRPEYVEIAIRVPKDTPMELVNPLLDTARALGLEVRTQQRIRLAGCPLEVPTQRWVHPTVARIRAARVDLRGRGR